MAWPRWSRATVVAAALSAGPALGDPVSAAAPQDAETPGPGGAFSDPSLLARETPIADSIEPAVERFVRERLSPCGGPGGVPCFPVTLEVEGRRYSVRESLENLQFDDGPVPGAPLTAADMIQHGANPRPTSGSVGADPKAIVCKTRQLIRKLQGKSRTYYLYRVWDETGERALLRDRPLDPKDPDSPHFEYLPLGEFGDECAAMQAYLRSTHQIRARREAGGREGGPGVGLEMPPGDDPE